jgi:hypothetical protein
MWKCEELGVDYKEEDLLGRTDFCLCERFMISAFLGHKKWGPSNSSLIGTGIVSLVICLRSGIIVQFSLDPL